MLAPYLDVTRLLKRLGNRTLPTGVDRVGLEYVRHYRKHPDARAVISFAGVNAVLSVSDSARAFEILLEQEAPQASFALQHFVAGARTMLWRRSLDRGILLNTSHSGIDRPAYLLGLKRRGIRSVVMIHDLIPITHPEYCRPGIDAAHRLRIRQVLSHATGIVANSETTMMALAEEAANTGLAVPPSIVAPLAPAFGSGTGYSASTRLLEHPYFVMLGTIEARKNHWMILHVWRELVERYGDAAPRLVIIGRRGWECENVLDMLDRCVKLRGVVIEESNCPDPRVREYLTHASALLFPSFAEGYGMPLAEALALKVPVIASDLPAFREIAADIPDYVNPLDGPGWLKHIEAFATSNSPRRCSQLARIEHFHEPTWPDHFAIVDNFIEALG